MALVDYDSSDSELDDDGKNVNVNAGHEGVVVNPNSSIAIGRAGARSQGVKRKLPSLPLTFNTAPIDDPSLHQGRKRTRPFIDGEYATHIYIELKLSDTFCSILQDLLSSFPPSLLGNPLHPLFLPLPSLSDSSSTSGSRGTLHISLSQPLGLRRSQIQSFTSDLTRRLRSHSHSQGRGRFRLSLAGRCKMYYNTMRYNESQKGKGRLGDIKRLGKEKEENEKSIGGGRGFVALRVGAGAVELKHIVDAVLDPLLDIYHQPNYHSDPEFHTSIGWTLLRPIVSAAAAAEIDLDKQPDLQEEDEVTTRQQPLSVPYNEVTIEKVNDQFESKIMDGQPRNGWDINSVHVKVGREVFVIPLN